MSLLYNFKINLKGAIKLQLFRHHWLSCSTLQAIQVAFVRSRIFPSCRKFLRRSWLGNSCHTWWNLIYFPSFNQAVITPQRHSWFACYQICIHQSTTAKLQFSLCWTYQLRLTPWITTSSFKDSKHPLESTVEHWTGWSHSFVVELSLFKLQSSFRVARHRHWGAAGISAWTTFIRALHGRCTRSCGKSWCWGSAICGRHSGIPALQGEWSDARSHWARKHHRRNQRLDVIEPLEIESQQDTVYLDWQ